MAIEFVVQSVRVLWRERLHTLLTCSVLALGLLSLTAAHVFVDYLRGYDGHFANSKRIFVVYQSLYSEAFGVSLPLSHRSAPAVGENLRLELPNAPVARYKLAGQAYVTVEGEPRYRRVAGAEQQFLQIFNFDTVVGDLQGLLVDPSKAALTEDAAKSLFGTVDVVGKIVTVTGRARVDVVIAAVIKSIPDTSHLGSGLGSSGFDLLLSWDALKALEPSPPNQADWFSASVITYVLLPEDGSVRPGDVKRLLASIARDRIPSDRGFETAYDLRHVSDLSIGLVQSQFQGIQAIIFGQSVLSILQFVSALVLGIACLNFVNLATARAAERARQAAIRKAIGATSLQVAAQELLLTAICVWLSIMLAVALVAGAAHVSPPPWNSVLAIPWGAASFWLFVGGVMIVVTLAAGTYPALLLARSATASALKSQTLQAGPRRLRVLLVGAQFTLAAFTTGSMFILISQGATIRDALLGRFGDQYVVINPSSQPEAYDAAVFADEMAKGRGIKGTTAVQQYPWEWEGSRPWFSRNPGQDAVRVTTELSIVGYDYFEVMDVPLLAGRSFSKDRSSDVAPMGPQEFRTRPAPASIVIDRAAAQALGWSNANDAVGATVYRFGLDWQRHEIVGVAESVPASIKDRGSRGVVYYFNPALAAIPIVRISKETVDESLRHIDSVLKRMAAGRPTRGRAFLDEAFENRFRSFSIVNKVLVAISVLALAIAGAGLFGMASYVTSRRTREIGVRKTQGATSLQVLLLLLIDFARPVFVANLVAVPLTLLVADRYRSLFAEPIALSPLPFLIALLATCVVAVAAVASRTFHASKLRPTEALRYE